MNYKIYVLLGIVLLPVIVYFLSRVQMKGWFHEFNKQLIDKSNIFKSKKDDTEKFS